MKIRGLVIAVCASALIAGTFTAAPAQAGDVRPVQFPAPASLGMPGQWTSERGVECGKAGLLVTPCIAQFWQTGKPANATWRMWEGNALRLRTAAQRDRLVASALQGQGGTLVIDSLKSWRRNGVATYAMTAKYFPFPNFQRGRAREVMSVYGNRIVVLFYGFGNGNSATGKNVPSMAKMVQISRSLVLPSAGAIPLVRTIS